MDKYSINQLVEGLVVLGDHQLQGQLNLILWVLQRVQLLAELIQLALLNVVPGSGVFLRRKDFPSIKQPIVGVIGGDVDVKEFISLSTSVLNNQDKMVESPEFGVLSNLIVDIMDLLGLVIHSLDNSLSVGVKDINNETVKEELLTDILSWVVEVLGEGNKGGGFHAVQGVLNSGHVMAIILLRSGSGSSSSTGRKSIGLEEGVSVDKIRSGTLLRRLLTSQIGLKVSMIIEVSWDQKTRRELGEFDNSSLLFNVDLNTTEFDDVVLEVLIGLGLHVEAVRVSLFISEVKSLVFNISVGALKKNINILGVLLSFPVLIPPVDVFEGVLEEEVIRPFSKIRESSEFILVELSVLVGWEVFAASGIVLTSFDTVIDQPVGELDFISDQLSFISDLVVEPSESNDVSNVFDSGGVLWLLSVDVDVDVLVELKTLDLMVGLVVERWVNHLQLGCPVGRAWTLVGLRDINDNGVEEVMGVGAGTLSNGCESCFIFKVGDFPWHL